MKQYGVNELRKMFLEFFESKGHLGGQRAFGNEKFFAGSP